MAQELLQFFLSGGASNSDPALSLGGVESTTTQVTSETVAYAGSGITGITLIDGDGNGTGQGTIDFAIATTSARWTKPGGAAAGAPEMVDISSDGNYVLLAPEGDATLTIAVVAASLPVGDASDNVDCTTILANLLHNITDTAQTLNGHEDYLCIYARNVSGVNKRVRVWIADNVTPDTLWIGTTTTTSGSTEPTIPNETTAPAGVTFAVHNALGNALDLTVNAAESIGLWFKREIFALTVDSNNFNDALIQFDVTDP